MWIEPVTLSGRGVRLEPLAEAHAAALWAGSSDPAIYRYKPYHLASEDDLRAFIAAAARLQARGEGLALRPSTRAAAHRSARAATSPPIGSTVESRSVAHG